MLQGEKEMKYRSSEQKQVDLINKNAAKLDRKANRLSDMVGNLEKKTQEAYTAARLERHKIYGINAKVIKRCKHKGERRYTRNFRDDASFENWCHCADCEETLWDECK